MNRKVVILIFAHKPTLQWYEAIGLEQCFRVLGHHPIRLVCPTGLDVSAYRRITPALDVEVGCFRLQERVGGLVRAGLGLHRGALVRRS